MARLSSPISRTSPVSCPTAGAALGSTPHASMMLAVPCAAMACPMGTIGASGRLVLVGSSVCSGEPRPSYWNRFSFFSAVLWGTVQIGPGFSGEPSIQSRGSLENRPFPDTSARPGQNSASRPGRNSPVSGRQPAAFASTTWPGETGTQRILRSGFLEMTVEDFAVVASAMTLEAESRRSETGPPAFRVGDDPRRTPIAAGRSLRAPSVFNRNGRSSAHSTDGARPGGEGICLTRAE